MMRPARGQAWARQGPCSSPALQFCSLTSTAETRRDCCRQARRRSTGGASPSAKKAGLRRLPSQFTGAEALREMEQQFRREEGDLLMRQLLKDRRVAVRMKDLMQEDIETPLTRATAGIAESETMDFMERHSFLPTMQVAMLRSLFLKLGASVGTGNTRPHPRRRGPGPAAHAEAGPCRASACRAECGRWRKGCCA